MMSLINTVVSRRHARVQTITNKFFFFENRGTTFHMYSINSNSSSSFTTEASSTPI